MRCLLVKEVQTTIQGNNTTALVVMNRDLLLMQINRVLDANKNANKKVQDASKDANKTAKLGVF